MTTELSMQLFDNISNDVPRTPIIVFLQNKLIKNHPWRYVGIECNYEHNEIYLGYQNKLITENYFQDLIDNCCDEQITNVNTKCISINNIKSIEPLFENENFEHVWLMLLPNKDCITLNQLFTNNIDYIHELMNESYFNIRKDENKNDAS